MLILIDILGSSNEKDISGLMVHVKANVGDRCDPHTTKLEVEPWSCLRHRLHIFDIGNLTQSEYILNPALIPSYVLQVLTIDVFQQMANLFRPAHFRRSAIHLLASNVYGELVSNNNNQERWTSSLNCQKFAKLFIVDRLGLKWPDIDIAGDQLPLVIDFGTMFLSMKENIKSKIEHGK